MLHNIAVHLGADEPPPVDDEEEHSEDEAPNPAVVSGVLYQKIWHWNVKYCCIQYVGV